MRLVTVLGLFATIFLAYFTSIDRLIPQIFSEYPRYDVAFVNFDPDLLERVLPSMSSANPARIINRVQYSTNRQCSVFFLQLPMTAKQIARIPCRWIFLVQKTSLLDETVLSTASSLWFLGIVHATFVIYDPCSKSYELFWFDRLNKKISGNGYHYRVHTKRLQPYFYYDAEYKLTGLDDELMRTIGKSQNVTIEYFMYEDNYPIWVASQDDPQLKYTYDMSLRIGHKPERDLLDKVFLPEWEELCVAVPKTQLGLMILQLTRPFQL